jgi:hypothetical protein
LMGVLYNVILIIYYFQFYFYFYFLKPLKTDFLDLYELLNIQMAYNK